MIRSDRKLTLLYAAGDLFTIILAFVSLIFYFRGPAFTNLDGLQLTTLTMTWFLIASKNKVYYLHLHNSIEVRFKNHLKTHFEYIGALCILYIMLRIPNGYSRVHFVSFLVGFFVSNTGVNYLLAQIVRFLRTRGKNVRKALVIGAGNVGAHIEKYFYQNPDFGYRIVGFLDDYPHNSVLKDKILGPIDQIDRVLRTVRIDEVIIALPADMDDKLQYVLDMVDYYGIRVRLVPGYFHLLGKNHKITSFGDIPVINVREISLDRYHLFLFKRFCDIVFSVTALIMLAPLFLLLAIVIKLESRGPVFYCPVRLGQDRRRFKLYKFRSMYQNDATLGGTASTTKNDPRVTRVGHFIRKYSLDELPQFFNVLIGDMSVVGPRPHRVYLNEMMQKEIDNYMIRHYLKPGITGWAQVNGWRGPTDTEEQKNNRTMHDLWYVENWSPMLDFKIVFLTVFGVKTHKAAF
ncbi:MAG: undecaprenyl-phosphate glucose phosphotransferase [Bacteroidetes bacterium]|nr:undecaprenyl-phosphate glucose phosphotransferase [Bacteroidota bacterium]